MKEHDTDERADEIVRAYLDELSRSAVEGSLPSAEAIWERARVARRIERRRDLVRRAVQPIVWVERGLGIAAAAATATWTWWRWELVVSMSERLVESASAADPWTLLGLAASIAAIAVIAADRAAAALRTA